MSLAKRLSDSINRAIDVPYLTEIQEEALLGPLCDLIVQKLPERVVLALTTAEQFVPPELLNQTLTQLIGWIRLFLIQRVPALRWSPVTTHIAKGIATHVLSFTSAGKTLPVVE